MFKFAAAQQMKWKQTHDFYLIGTTVNKAR